MRATAVYMYSYYVSDVVDLFDNGTGRWSTAQLSQARWALSATSVGTVAIFAGGQYTSEQSNVVDLYDGKLLRIGFVCFARKC
jgi:hypothetical protein